MPNRVRVLVVEDRDDQAESIEKACTETISPSDLLIEVASDSAAALDLLARQHFDVAVCDVAIPKDRYSIVPDVKHGLAVVQQIRAAYPGTPLIVLSDYGNDPHVLRGIRRGPPSGGSRSSGLERPSHTDRRYPTHGVAAHELSEALRRSHRVASLPVSGAGAASLEPHELRIIQIFSLGAQGAAAEVSGLAGGHSGAKTLRVRVRDSDDHVTALVVAKLGTQERVLREQTAFSQASMLLPVDLAVPLTSVVVAGAGGFGGAFYRLADEHTRDLSEALATAPHDARQAAGLLAASFRDLNEQAVVKTVSMLKIRREIVGSSDASAARALQQAVQDLDSRDVETRWCLQHGDLHGKNVLLNAHGQPLLIDYGDVRKSLVSLDPITLELSTIFHPANAAARGDWPTEAQAAKWTDLDAFVVGCPFEEYVRSCRAWSQRVASNDERLALVLAYSLRQLKFPRCPEDLAMAMISHACEKLGTAAPE